MRSSLDFQRTVRQGVRAGRPTLVVHALRVDVSEVDPTTPVRVGLVVSKGVGNAVVRSRVKRRLRHLARPLALATDHPLHVVIRALPAAATSDQLDTDLALAWARASDKAYA
ncbi:ribonuclease P protein component [Mariniluteicoccus endophyticus]